MAVVFVEHNSLAKVEAYLSTQRGLQAVVTVPGGGMHGSGYRRDGGQAGFYV